MAPASKTAALKAETARERQAEAALANAHRVLAEIELAAKARRRIALDDASGRFCNLIALALFHCAGEVAGTFDMQLKDGIDQLRSRLLDMGSNMMVEKIRRVHERAAGVLGGGPYPLGLAEALRQSLAQILDNLKLLGAWQRLSEADRALIDQTQADVAQLAAFEARYGLTLKESGQPHGVA